VEDLVAKLAKMQKDPGLWTVQERAEKTNEFFQEEVLELLYEI